MHNSRDQGIDPVCDDGLGRCSAAAAFFSDYAHVAVAASFAAQCDMSACGYSELLMCKRDGKCFCRENKLGLK